MLCRRCRRLPHLAGPPFGPFRFESKRRLLAAQNIEQVEPDGKLLAYVCLAAEGPPLILHRLLYRRITAVEREDFRLTFRIDDGSALAVLSELGPHESGHIQARGSRSSNESPITNHRGLSMSIALNLALAESALSSTSLLGHSRFRHQKTFRKPTSRVLPTASR
jgi:hypothetical protein